MDKIVVPLSNGYRLVAERNTGEFDKEIYIGIETSNGSYYQDLVIVRPTYKLNNEEVLFDSDKFEMLVFGDETIDDYTKKFTVGLCNNGE